MDNQWQPIDNARWTRVKALFTSLADLPQEQRESQLLALETDTEVIAQVRILLANLSNETTKKLLDISHQPDFLSNTAISIEALRAAQLAREGQRLGPWELQKCIGSGGMGEVFQARRADGLYDSLAAVKLLRYGRDGTDILQRFSSEQKVLAKLNHPHIARLLDAGQAEDGSPYFVMELVQGQAIDVACVGLSIEQRLNLFLQLCQAVAHAHSQLLVHRDLKPSNVLVDQDGQVKLLDFGIAKAIDGFDSASLDQTNIGQRPFTPTYASPEQVRGDVIGTATDIYSLGVLLYVLLTGIRPYGRNAQSPMEIARCVLEETPTKPSSLSTDQVLDDNWLHTRKKLKGDLDNILLKTLDKNVASRYSSVEALASDIRAHLSGHPVSAHAPRFTYLASKFISRHRLGLTLGGVAAAIIVSTGSLAIWQGHQAALARDEANHNFQRIRTITNDLVLRYGDAVTNLPGGLQIKDDLLKALLKHLEALSKQAGNDPEWTAQLASVYARLAEINGDDTGASLNKNEEGRAFAEKAIHLAQQVWSRQKSDPHFVAWYMQALQVRALGMRASEKPDEAVKEMEQALQLLDEAAKVIPEKKKRSVQLNQAATLLRMGQFYDTQTVPSLNKPEMALEWFAKSEALLDKLGSAQDALQWHQIRATLFGARALTKARLNGIKDARSDAEKAVIERQSAAKLAPNNTAVLDGLISESANLGVILLRQPDAPAALKATTVSWNTVEKLARENGAGNKWEMDLGRVALHHGRALVLTDHFKEAQPIVQAALDGLALRAKTQASPHIKRMQAWQSLYLAQAMYGNGERQAAIEMVHQAIEVLTPFSKAEKARDALLNLGEAQVILMQWEPAQQQKWRKAAFESYEKAHVLLALAGDHEVQYIALGGKP